MNDRKDIIELAVDYLAKSWGLDPRESAWLRLTLVEKVDLLIDRKRVLSLRLRLAEALAQSMVRKRFGWMYGAR